jgi:hypothetical protein
MTNDSGLPDSFTYRFSDGIHATVRIEVRDVPLLEPDPDLTLDLQPLIDDYALGRYHERIDNTRPLTPSLSKAEATWVREALKKRLDRSAK